MADKSDSVKPCPRVVGSDGARLILCGRPLPCAEHGGDSDTPHVVVKCKNNHERTIYAGEIGPAGFTMYKTCYRPMSIVKAVGRGR